MRSHHITDVWYCQQYSEFSIQFLLKVFYFRVILCTIEIRQNKILARLRGRDFQSAKFLCNSVYHETFFPKIAVTKCFQTQPVQRLHELRTAALYSKCFRRYHNPQHSANFERPWNKIAGYRSYNIAGPDKSSRYMFLQIIIPSLH